MISTQGKLRQIRNIALERPPSAGHLWQGVPHGAFIAAMEAELKDYGYVVDTIRAATSADKLTLVASFVTQTELVSGLDVCVTLISSNNRDQAPRLVYGAVDRSRFKRGFALEEHKMGRLYKEFDVPMNCAAAVAGIKTWKADAVRWIQRTRSETITVDEAILFLAHAAQDTLPCAVKIPWANVAKTVQHFWLTDKHTVWSLYEAFSEVTQMDPVMKQVPRLLLFADRLRSVFYSCFRTV